MTGVDRDTAAVTVAGQRAPNSSNPHDLTHRAAHAGFHLLEACCWWDPDRPPTPTEHRYQLALGLPGP